MDHSIERFCAALARSGLLPEADLGAARDAWEKARGGAAGVGDQAFAGWLVGQGRLTEYQAKILLSGKPVSFHFGPYTIQDQLGRGRFAGIYKATHRLGQTVAIKVLPASKAGDPQVLGRFLRESRLAMRLKHPNVVRTFETGDHAGIHYLVMEYLDAETLGDLIKRRGRLAPPDAARLMAQAFLGLQHLHEKDLIHRDLNPSNILVVADHGDTAGSKDGPTVKLAEIGLAKAMFDENAPTAAAAGNFELTTEGSVLGTPEYMAPEQARDPQRADIRSDVYSLGCVLYHALTGRPPFDDPNLARLLVRHAKDTPKPVRELAPDVPDDLADVVARLLAKDPAQRYPTPDRAAQALLKIAGTRPPSRRADPAMEKYLAWLEENSPSGEHPVALGTPTPPTPIKPVVPAASAPASPTPVAVVARPAAAPPRELMQALAEHERTAKVESPARPAKPKSDSRSQPERPAKSTVQPPGLARGGGETVDALPAAEGNGPEEEADAVAERRAALNRREFFIFGVGMAFLVFGLIVVFLTAWVLQKTSPKDRPRPPEK